jgi:DNA-binding NarL/FixJ family response regulator
MHSPLRLAIADDALDLRAGLQRRLAFFPDIEVVASEPSGDKLLASLERVPAERMPHVVLMDVEMPGLGGIEATRSLKHRWPAVRVVMFTVFENDDKLRRALEAGACGYLLKDEPISRLAAALTDAVEGRAPLSASAASVLIDEVRSREQHRQQAARRLEASGLTPRECDVLKLLAVGHTDASAAGELFVSVHTVQSHTKSIYRKLDIHSRAEAVLAASEMRLIE